MAIVKMKRLRLLAVQSQKAELLRELMLLGCVEISDPDARLEDSELSALVRRGTGESSRYRADHASLLTSLKILDKYVPGKSKLLSPRPEISTGVFLDNSSMQEMISLAAFINRSDDQIRRIAIEEGRQRGIVESLLPWKSLELPIDYIGTKTCVTFTGMVPSSIDLDELEKTLESAVDEAQVIRVSSGREQHYLMIICLREVQQEVMEALRAFGFTLPSLGAMVGTASENIAAAENKLKELAKEKQELASQIAAQADSRDSLKLCYDRVKALLDRAEAAERMLLTESAFSIEGWVSEPEIDSMCAVLEKYDCAWALEDPVQEEYPQVPVKLKSGKLTRSLSMVTEMYSLPAYGSVDPNPLMAPFFIVFYGMMMGDMAYGILMTIAGILVTRKKKPKGTMAYLFELMIPCGISTIFWGAMTGGFLGDFIPQLVRIFNPQSTFEWFWPPLFTPLDDTIAILAGAMILGFIHLMTGTVISFTGKARAGKVMDGVWDEGSWWLIFIGIGLAVLGLGNVGGIPVVLVIGAIMLVVGAGRNAKGALKIVAAFDAVYSGVTGYFGDILSYSRLMALMLAGSVIAQVFNTLGAIPGNVVIFIIISLLGNALNFILNLLSCFVHDLRLQCLEFFGKFYEDGGRPFLPLEINTKYYDIVKE